MNLLLEKKGNQFALPAICPAGALVVFPPVRLHCV